MALSIKNPETERLARQLAVQTGESVTLAITVAISERLHRQTENSHRKNRMEWLERLTDGATHERSSAFYRNW